ncbi:polyphosphoinositide phosphatase FIG4 [Rhodnius prolixus]
MPREGNTHFILYPVISSIQKIIVYDMKDTFYVVGSNNTQTVFRVLRINRMDPCELIIVDDKMEYSNEEIKSFFQKIDSKTSKSTNKYVSAFGIVGFVRFMEGYYMILVTKRRRIATIGLHYIYKVEDTTMIYIPNESVKTPHPDEARYVKMFQSIDLSSNFYFSYSYDLTHSLQINMALPKGLKDMVEDVKEEQENVNKRCGVQKNERLRLKEVEVNGRSNEKFVWNSYLLSEIVAGRLSQDWILHMVHGFVSQANISVFGRSVYVTLIARRSNKYAGTRFLKRGANFNGDVANEVETEQLVEDMGVSSWPTCPRISSFVQMRGSVPGHWSQDTTKIVPKPTISYDIADPFAETPGRHFKQLFDRYGAPIIVLNLVKQREKKKHESTLSEQFSSDIKYLNQFLPPNKAIQYVTFDMARKNKGSKANVLGRLAKISENALSKTGVYLQTGRGETLQTGIIRVNCVDCLDRTNTAQFALGKCALAIQLSGLGLLGKGRLDFDCDCTRLLEVLYEDHGDTLALQYGGSQLVHRIKTYRKTAPWTSQGNDIMQTLSRYYSNTFSDSEKQHAMNLFLGLFIPRRNETPIWEQTTDFYLHHPETTKVLLPKFDRLPLTQWWGEEDVQCLAKDYREREAIVNKLTRMDRVDLFTDFHRTHEFTPFTDVFTFTMSHTVRDFAPHCVTDLSPFTVRIGPGRRRDDIIKGNPSLTGHCSTTSNTSSDSCSQDSDEEEIRTDSRQSSSPAKQSTQSNMAPLCFVPKQPSVQDMLMYKRYVEIGRQATVTKGSYTQLILQPVSKLKSDSSFEVTPPKVSAQSLALYESFVAKKYNTLDDCILPQQAEKYARYANNQFYMFQGNPWTY